VPDADELFPLLMYVVLNSDMENLRIHVEYIIRGYVKDFSYIFKFLRKDLALGRLGYLNINLKAIIHFLNDIDGQSLMNEGKLRVKRADGKNYF
jgi:hypothetical protein